MGEPLAQIQAAAVDFAGPRIDAEAARTVPAHGRVFWWSMSRSIGWGAAAAGSLLVIGSFGARPVPVLKVAIFVGVLLWAVGFGLFAANQRVRERRRRIRDDQRGEVSRLAQEAARYVWAAEVPGDWQPLGPDPEATAGNDMTLPTAWLRRFGATDADAVGRFVDGTEASVRRAVGAARGAPVVLFVAEPGFFTDHARGVADACGIALFVVGRIGLLPMSRAASDAIRTYRDPTAIGGPVGGLLSSWAKAAKTRDSALTTSFR
jgi:hypothetical protein